ncbi:hypothetical protein GHT06_015993 [Daphnia sinensis]|uniref:CUB domain-containing protein n=1 Tax=Daphnia sinensis TaxID=1820382 RepID=A0AAD5KRP6_9CRUS|nr:hypothetical protein GHT06_015993 [Daphnia sinensis]
MLKLKVLFSIVLMLRAGRACDDVGEEEDSVLAYDYNANPWNSFYYQPRNHLSVYDDLYPKGRTSINRPELILKPPNAYFTKRSDAEDKVEGRFALRDFASNFINTGIFNNRFTPANTWRPFANLVNRIPFTYNPNFDSPLSNFDTCTGSSGLSGICVYDVKLWWYRHPEQHLLQSPLAVSTPSTCVLTVKLDTKFAEQRRPICQIRLDFISFTMAQPSAGTCLDTFQVGGATTEVPIICGDNSGQHMYLDVPSSDLTSSSIQLMFNFQTASGVRSWNIKIAMLPCGASYLSPVGCLQYFTSATGKVKSFNWQDTPTGGIRQLNNQNYNICFRTELVSSQRAAQICLSVCSVTNGGDAFSLTTPAAVKDTGTGFNAITISTDAAASNTAKNSNVGTIVRNGRGAPVATCLYDFLAIGMGRDANGIVADRYCGNQLNPLVGTLLTPGSATSSQVCTPMKPFVIKYQTDGTEAEIKAITLPSVPAFARSDVSNTGFCLDYQEL